MEYISLGMRLFATQILNQHIEVEAVQDYLSETEFKVNDLNSKLDSCLKSLTSSCKNETSSGFTILL